MVKEQSTSSANYYGKDISTKEIVNQIVAKVMLESSCEEPDSAKSCSGCLHENSESCPKGIKASHTEIFPGIYAEEIWPKEICDKYERKYNPCGKCKYHHNLICKNPKSCYCGRYVYYYEGCPWHADKEA